MRKVVDAKFQRCVNSVTRKLKITDACEKK